MEDRMTGLLEAPTLETKDPMVVGSIDLFRIQRRSDQNPQWLALKPDGKLGWTRNREVALGFTIDHQVTMEFCLDTAKYTELPILTREEERELV